MDRSPRSNSGAAQGLVSRTRSSLRDVPNPLKYAVVERERRYLVGTIPNGVRSTTQIVDHYVDGTRLRLREVRAEDGTVTRKLGHTVRLAGGPGVIAVTNLYLDDTEWALLSQLPATVLRKTRHLVRRDGLAVAVDENEDGTLVAEIDDGDEPSESVPDWLDVIEDVTGQERWTGAGLARRVSGRDHGT